jgi:YHS domain-containing protein
MNLIVKSTWTVLLLGAAVGCAGDSETAAPAPPATPRPATVAGKPAPEGVKDAMGAKAPNTTKGDTALKVEGPKSENSKADSAADKLTDEELDAIKELPASEQDIAREQRTCPVSGDHLGSMGKPFKVTAEGRTFYLCCDGCEKKVKADPKAYIAKLDAKKSEK